MKYSFMSFSCTELNLDEMLLLAKRFGYDGIEPRIDSKHNHGVELDTDATMRKDIKEKAIESDIAICCIATSCRYMIQETAKEQVKKTLQCIELAADIGSPCVRVFGGKIPEGVNREQAIDLLVESLEAVASYAEERGVTVCLETHDDWCNPNYVAEVVNRVGHHSIGVNWDAMHPVRTGISTIENSFKILRPWIRHVHAHDGEIGNGHLKPIGEGVVDHRAVVKLLQESHYKGYISGEWIDWEPYEIHLPRELASLKRYEKECKEK